MTIAWITGGGTGIGRALAESLYRDGARVVISGRRPDVLEAAARDISSHPGGEVLPIAGNAADPAHIAGVILRVKEKWGPVDLLINNAGANTNHAFDQSPPAEYEEVFINNTLSAIRATQAVLPDMLVARKGAIVNISSIYGLMASGRSASYTVSKHALSGYTEVLRQGVEGTGVHVLGVYPGFIRTAMTLPFVRTGSIRSYLGKSPEALAEAIRQALRKKKRHLYYPWYVPWALRLNRWMPGLTELLAQKVKR